MNQHIKEFCINYDIYNDGCDITKGKCILDDETECPNFEGNLEWFLEL